MIRKLSPAKINLHLKVLGKRPDGYHDIASLMQQVSLYDELIFERRESGIVLTCPDTGLPVNEDNIVFRAARAIFALKNHNGGVKIEIRKRIPIAAGLGGGSSNAATTLFALNDLFNFQLTSNELLNLGKKLGADVPFFIFGKTAWATGIGEILTDTGPVPSFWLVLINPGFEVSTRTIYQSLNLTLTSGPVNYTIPPLYSRDDLICCLRNDLEAVATRLHPEIAEMKGLLKSAGALGSLMSGSGPTVFGLFPAEEEARKAAASIVRLVPAAWIVTVACSL